MKDPLVSVIMPVYNCESYVGDAIRSILDQSYTNFEFLIIDDASTDGTLRIIKTFDDPRLLIFEKPLNTGYTESLNFGLGIAKGKYIARMDGDDISLPERFGKQVAFMESHPKVIVCGTNLELLGNHKLMAYPETHETIKIGLLEGTCFGHPTVMIRKEILDRNNLFYDIDKEPAEDYALWVELLRYGQFYNLQEVLLYYRVHDNQVSQKKRKIQLKSKLSTRLKLLEYLGIQFQDTDINVLKKVLTFTLLNFNEVLSFIRIKHDLIIANKKSSFFNQGLFESYLNDQEFKVVKLYFLNRDQFSPMVYRHYIKIKNQLFYKLSFRTHIIFFIKCLFFYKPKNVYIPSIMFIN